MSRFQFVDDHHTTHGVKRLCQVLGLNRSSFYRWRAGRDARAARRDADKALVKRMREYHQEFDGTIGVRRMTIELNEKADQPINHKRVERLMRTHNIVGVNLRKPKKTTVKDQGARVVDDFLKRKFRAIPLSGHRHRRVLPASGRLVDRRPYAHQSRRRRPGKRGPGAGLIGRGRIPLRPRTAIHLLSLPDHLSAVGSPPVDGPDRFKCG